MITSIRKMFINYEKEEAWLNRMAAMGMNCVHYSFLRYLFVEGNPGEYIYRIELLKEMPNHPESKAYLRFMEESGVECVSTYLRWVYFRKKAADGPFELFTDADSKISHLKRVSWLMGIVGGLNVVVGLWNLLLGIFAQRAHFNAYFSSINLFLGVAVWILVISYVRRIFKLKKERALHE